MTAPLPGTITESKLRFGELVFGRDPEDPVATPGVPFACQAKNVRITPSVSSEGDPLETLCGAAIGTDDTVTAELTIVAIQDFDDPDGFTAYTWTHQLEDVPFYWRPNANGPYFQGRCKVIPVEIGGDVKKRLEHEAKFPIIGDVAPVYPSAPPAG